jgi:hypothetical protein
VQQSWAANGPYAGSEPSVAAVFDDKFALAARHFDRFAADILPADSNEQSADWEAPVNQRCCFRYAVPTLTAQHNKSRLYLFKLEE